jgi:adenylate cyclase
VHLRPQTYEVLKYLVENKGRLVSKNKLIQEIWKGRAVTDGSLGKCIEEVRQASGPEAHSCVRNVRGRGYIFDRLEDEKFESPTSRIEYVDVVRVLIDEEEVEDENNSGTAAIPTASVAPPLRFESKLTTTKSWLVIGAVFLTAVAVVVGSKSTVNRSGTIKSIAVLPLRNDSANPEPEYLSDGVTESLINRLSPLSGTKVIASSSSCKYKGKEIDAPQVASALGVEAILTAVWLSTAKVS